MKRLGAIISLSLLIVLMAVSTCFAGTFTLEDSYPRDGDTNKAIDNFGVKLYFNEDVLSKENEAANKKCFVIKDAEGNKVPTLVVYSPKEEGLVMVLADYNNKDFVIQQDTEYTLSISEDFVAANGDVLGESTKITFKTLNQSRAMTVNMVLMGVMFAGMFFFSSKSMKKEQEKRQQEEKVNPYKVAKETGKSVEEIVAKDQKAKEKKRKAEARKAARDAGTEIAEEDIDPDNYRVKGPRPISEGNSTYKTGRKALAEEKKRKEAAAKAKGTTKPKNQSGKSKNNKKK